ncbi:unnamed protein product [Pleuronectes platessa]|uniref:Uncharacterized protein n=1 Tax=Pleuronectes platessa TaxID=8262 RepID=A0A9N7V8E9_PLEPL|nr:unnamed protein product [Pleuronectes platessa]
MIEFKQNHGIYISSVHAAAYLLSRRRGGASAPEPAANEHDAVAAPLSAARSEQSDHDGNGLRHPPPVHSPLSGQCVPAAAAAAAAAAAGFIPLGFLLEKCFH